MLQVIIDKSYVVNAACTHVERLLKARWKGYCSGLARDTCSRGLGKGPSKR